MAVHGVAERSAISQLNVLLLLQNSQLKLCVLQSLHVYLEVAVLFGLINEGMMVITRSFSAFFPRDHTGTLASRIHNGVRVIDMHLNHLIFVQLFPEVDVVAHANLMLELLVDGKELDGLELVDTLTGGRVDVGGIEVGVAEVEHILCVGFGLDGEGTVLLSWTGLP